MEAITIEASFVRAASACRARSDVRTYLNGIFLDSDGAIVGTNGHVLFVTKGDHKPPKNGVIIDLKGKIPAKATRIDLMPLSDGVYGLAKCYSENLHKSANKLIPFEIIEGNYADYKIAMPDGPPQEASEIGFNPKYFSLAEKVFGANGCRMTFRGKNSAVVLRPAKKDNWPADTLMLIMPVKL